MLERLFTSNVRLRLLQLFLSHCTNKYYQRQLEKLLSISVRSVQIELNNLLEIGLLKKEVDGNRTYYSVNEKFPLIKELQALILKGSFFIDELEKLLSDKDVKLAFVYGSAAKGDLLEGSDIDLFIIGSVNPYELHKAIKILEGDFSRVVNYVVYSPKEMSKKSKERTGFVVDVINNDKLFIKGTEDEFRKIIKR